MPITQHRMLTLIESAEAFQVAYDGLCEAFARYSAAIKLGQLTHEQAFDQLALTTSVNLHATPRQCIALERMRYNLTHHKNSYDRKRKARQRGVQAPQEPQAQWQRPHTAAEIAAQLEAEEQAQAPMPAQAQGEAHLDERVKDEIMREVERAAQALQTETELYASVELPAAPAGGEGEGTKS